jgi:MT0933-like antitoxin protein
MGFLDKAKKMAVKAGPLIDKAAPHARTVADKAGQQIDKRTGGKYHDKIEQVGQKVGEYADRRTAAGGTGPAAADDAFPPTPPPVTTPAPVDGAEATGTTAPSIDDPETPTDRPTL